MTRHPYAPGVTAAGLVTLVCLAAIAIGLPTQTDFPWSASVLLDAGWRMSLGQVPHIDFHTPIGPAYFLALRAATALVGTGPDCLGLVTAAFAAIAGAAAWALAAGRLQPWWACLAATMCALLAATPALFGSLGVSGISHGGHYSRCAWALFTVVAIVACCPRLPDASPSTRRSIMEAIILGALLGALFCLKVTFAMAGAGLLILAYLRTDRPAISAMVTTVAAALLTTLMVTASVGTTITAYIADLGQSAASASSVRLVAGYLNDIDALLIALAGGTVLLVMPPRPWRLTGVLQQRWVAIIALAGAGVGLSATNGIETTSPIVLVLAIVLLAAANGLTPHRRSALLALAGCVLTVWFIRLATPMMQLVGKLPAATATVPRGPYVGREFLAAGRPAPTDAALLDNLSRLTNAHRTDLWWRYVHQGMEVLDDRVTPETRILNLDFINPFPYALATQPVSGDLLFWHFQRNVTERNAPTAATLLATVDLVMEPKHPIFPDSLALKLRLYQQTLDEAFLPVAENSWWRLHARRPRGTP